MNHLSKKISKVNILSIWQLIKKKYKKINDLISHLCYEQNESYLFQDFKLIMYEIKNLQRKSTSLIRC